jgi:formiminotetrahydrofolate cyclodeaminase
VAGALAQSALTGALSNVEINLADLNDAAFVGEVRKRTAALQR